MTKLATITNPLPHLFLGEWTVLASQKTNNASNSAFELKSIKIQTNSESNSRDHQKYVVQLLGPASKVLHEYKCSFEKDSETLCYQDGGEKFGCISFWRNQAYDAIFALEEIPPTGEMKQVWTARRKPCETPSSPKDFLSNVVGKPWEVVLTKGAHGAKQGFITIRSFDESSSSDEAPASKTRRFAGSGLYGLYHSKEEPGSPYILYDVLAYDNQVKSFNSIFGVRSLNFWIGSGIENGIGITGGNKRIFATFNNKFSIPATHFLSQDSGSGIQNCIGSLMAFEKDQLGQRLRELLQEFDHFLDPNQKSDESSHLSDLDKIQELALKLKQIGLGNDDPDDPDIGIWVGVPTTPPQGP